MQQLERSTLELLERAGWDSLCNGTGGSLYGDLMTPDAVMVLVNGWILDTAAVKHSLNDSPPWSRYALTEFKVVPTGVDSAALLYRAEAWRDGDPAPFVALMSSHYRRMGELVRLTFYQQTAIAA